MRRTLFLALISATARAPAFLIPILIAAIFGAGRETDAYFLAYNAALLLGGTLAQGMEQVIVPFAAREVAIAGGALRRYLDLAARRVTQAGAGLWIMGIPLLLLFTAPGLRGSLVKYSAMFTPFALAWCSAAVYAGALTSQWRIGTATGSMVLRGLGALCGLLAAPLGLGLGSVALGLGLGEATRAWWMRYRLWDQVSASPTGTASPMRPLASAAVAQATASAAIGVAPVVERLLAASLGAGAISHLEYAVRLLVVPGVLFDGAFAPLLLARWTAHITRTGTAPHGRQVLRSAARGMMVAGLIATLLAVFAPLFVRLTLGYGRLAADDLGIIASLLRVLAVSFVATMGALLLERWYLASTRNRTLAVLSLCRATLRVGTVVLLLPSRGVLAFGIAYVVADWSYLVALIMLLRAAPQLTVGPAS